MENLAVSGIGKSYGKPFAWCLLLLVFYVLFLINFHMYVYSGRKKLKRTSERLPTLRY